MVLELNYLAVAACYRLAVVVQQIPVFQGIAFNRCQLGEGCGFRGYCAVVRSALGVDDLLRRGGNRFAANACGQVEDRAVVGVGLENHTLAHVSGHLVKGQRQRASHHFGVADVVFIQALAVAHVECKGLPCNGAAAVKGQRQDIVAGAAVLRQFSFVERRCSSGVKFQVRKLSCRQWL